jgi:uncharacterized NAD-dependent epimerase/dehydratase family protein
MTVEAIGMLPGSLLAREIGEISGLNVPQPYLLFLGDISEPAYAKTAFGLRDWVPERCVGEFACGEGHLSTGLPYLTPAEAYARGARAMVIGVANAGGVILESWHAALIEALAAGLDAVSGMHVPLERTPALRDAARRYGRRLIDVRRPPPNIPTATGRKRTGMRLLTVGTDCALGKKYTALAIAREFATRGVDVDFRATGQTGILIAGGGIPMDAVVADFESGAAEMLSPDAPADHWDVIEGQGSLFHPAFSSVALGLLHGSQPDVIVVCHDPQRRTVVGLPDFPLPSVDETMEMTLALGRRTNPGVRCAGVSLNTSHFKEDAAMQFLAKESGRLRLPVADPMRGGEAFARLVDACLG